MSLGMDRESFLKGQLEAVQKALTKYEMPLKPKHARRLILGTHQEKSAAVFWNAVNRLQLEKNPVITWKFCHLLHKLLRDGHRKVAEESFRFVSRISSLSQFWRHLPGYGACIESYCKLLAQRLDFHHRNGVIPGSLQLNENQLKTLQNELDSSFELTIELLDQMDNLLDLQNKVYDNMESLRWSSLVPQGQCLLAPLILCILDTSKLYDYLVKMIFKLHSQIPPDALTGHRDRFRDIFRRTKKFYEESSNLQYFKYLVSIPTLPATAPNFLSASDLDSYQTPHAYLHSEGSDGDNRSVAEEALLDLNEEDTASVSQMQQHSPASGPDPRDEQLLAMQRALEDERFAKERLIAEARSRIEQYENRLAQIQGDYEHAKRESEENREDRDRIVAELAARDASRTSSDDARVNEAEAKARTSEERFAKLRAIYDKFRTEHVGILGKNNELQKQLEASEKERMDKDEELRNFNRRLENAESQKSALDESRSVADDLRSQLARADLEMENVQKEMTALRDAHTAELARLSAATRQAVLAGVASMLQKGEEDLQNATTITYPPHLAVASLAVCEQQLDKAAHGDQETLVFSGHCVVTTVVNCASAAYTASIQHFDDVNEQCKHTLVVAKKAYETGNLDELKANIRKLNDQITSLPVQNDVDKEVVGSEVELEMRRMDEAIRQAVAQIEEIQRKARESTDGVRLEVNEAILGCCQQLMNAIMILVSRSRELQEEIVAAGKGGANSTEFYKRNHQWTEGLLSAAKAVGVAARVLVSSADDVVGGTGKLEQLIVAAQEIAASTAQLFVSSRVKADRDSDRLSALSQASRNVNQCTAQVVASVKNAQTTLNDQDVLDFSHLTLHEAKKEEMESQVRMLELEQQLTRERARLAELRKAHYHMAQVVSSQNGQAKEDKDNSFELV